MANDDRSIEFVVRPLTDADAARIAEWRYDGPWRIYDPRPEDGPLQIGQLARRTGLSSRTIRFWSDSGLIPPVERSPGGYRRYDADAVNRLDLVRTLRELGLGLDAVRQVSARSPYANTPWRGSH